NDGGNDEPFHQRVENDEEREPAPKRRSHQRENIFRRRRCDIEKHGEERSAEKRCCDEGGEITHRRGKFGHRWSNQVDVKPTRSPQTNPPTPPIVVAMGPPGELPSAPIRIKAGTMKRSGENPV